VKPLLSLDAAEARHRVLSLYKAWYRQIPWMMREYNLPVTADMARQTLRKRFEENKHVKDIRVIDMLVVKVRAQEELRVCHISK
jgi:NADH dehydrogenase (ubiquinone) 1 alpha subcomplex subunit 6